ISITRSPTTSSPALTSTICCARDDRPEPRVGRGSETRVAPRRASTTCSNAAPTPVRVTWRRACERGGAGSFLGSLSGLTSSHPSPDVTREQPTEPRGGDRGLLVRVALLDRQLVGQQRADRALEVLAHR